MKNKTSRTNSMKLKKVIAASLAVFILFAFTGCKTSSGSATTESSKQEDTSTTDSSSSGDLNEKLNDLYQQENQIFADHKDVWDKAFGFMSKNIDDDTKNENYADFLANIIESNKDSFSEEEYATLSKDIETIRGIEEVIAKYPSFNDLLEHYTLEDILPLLFPNNYEILEKMSVGFKCSCSKESFKRALITLGKKELEDIISEDHKIETVCHYCGEKYTFTEDDIKELIKEMK